jgi:tetratricopeptide (TPR) repeat protein
MEMRKKLDIITAGLILGMALTPAHAAPEAGDSLSPKAARITAIEPVGVLLERAESLIDKRDFAAAETLLEQALRLYPENVDVVGEMGMSRLRQDKHAQAYEFFTRALELSHGKSERWRSLAKTARFWQLLREVREARAAKDFTLAETKLNEAIKLDPKVADAYAIFGGVEDDRGQASNAIAAYRQALSINPLNSEALEGLTAIYRRQGMTQSQRFIGQLSSAQRDVLSQTIAGMVAAEVEAQVNDQDEFLHALTRIPADKRSANISRMWGNNLEKLVDAHAKSGRVNDAALLLQEAETLAADDEEASLAVVASWGRLGDYRQADRIFDKLRAARTPPSARWYLRHASYLAMKDAPELCAELEAIASMPSLSSEEKRELYALQEPLVLRTANAQLDSGAPGLAHQTIAPLLKISPNRTPLLLVEARAYQAEKQWPLALSVYGHVLQLEPGASDAMRGQIEIKIASGDRAAALGQLDEWVAGGTSGNPYNGLKMADLYLALGEPGRAHQLFAFLLEQYPNQPIVLYEAAQMAHRDGHLDDEIAYLKRSVAADRSERAAAEAQALAQEPGKPGQALPGLHLRMAQGFAQAPDDSAPYQQTGIDGLGSPQKIQRDWKEKKLAELIDRRSDWFSSAVDVHSRSGTAGMLQLDSVEIPLEYKTSWHKNDEVLFRTDLIKLNAGDVAPANDRFGSMLLCPSACAPNMLRQAEQGMSFTAGYQRGDFIADIGFTPLDFPVSNIVGGIRQQVYLEEFGYSLEASRRPVTDSLLSFAGSHDPNTGQAWGGVVATGARLGISIDKGGAFGFWSTIGLHNLTGRNVQSNQRVQIMAGEQWRMINEENRKFIVGLTGIFLGFAEDAGEYTFGHGGYYSPNTYRSLSLPVTYTERSPRFSYMLRGSVSASRAQMQDAQYYPTNSSMQAQATALASTSFITPVYTGGSSKSSGYSLTAAWEYQVEPKLFAGGLLSIDRAESYSPNRAMLYLRYSLDHPGAQPVFMPPEPLEPSSQFK